MVESITSATEDLSYVNIHGNDVRVLICEKTGRILIPIDELKETGFSIYRKSQFNKLLVDDAQFTKEFNLFMLQSAQTYMLKNKIVFKENEILESINNCKKLLTESPNETNNSSSFSKNHVIKDGSDDNFTVNSVTNQFKQPPAPMTVQNVNSFNQHKTTPTARRSSSSSSENSKRSRSFGFNENDKKVLPPTRKSFEPQRKSQNFNQATSPPHNRNAEPGSKWEMRKPYTKSPASLEENTKKDSQWQLRKPYNKNHSSEESSEQEAKFEMKIANNKPPFPLEPLNSITLDKQEHNVIVTHVEEASPYVIWAQDVENASTLIEIDEKIKKELENERVVTRCELNNIYLAQDEGVWYRCKIIKFKPLTVCFVDYGNTAQVIESDLRYTSKDLGEIPAQAVKIIFKDHYKPTVYDTINIKIVLKKERGTYHATAITEESKKPEEIKTPVHPLYFNKIPLQCSLQNGQKIMIIGETNGKLAIRTKESYEKLKQIEEAIANAQFTPLADNKPHKNQIVVVHNKDKLKRAEIVNIDGSTVTLTCLDYHETIKVDCSQIQNITESLYKEPMTYLMTPPLKGYEVGNQKALDYVQELVNALAKAVVVLHENDFDLKIENTLLSARLESLNDRVMLKNLQMYRPQIGRGNYMLYACRDVDNVTLVSQEEVEKYVDDVIKTGLDEDDEEEYVPILGEVCLGIYQGSWSRCVIIRILTGRYEVRYIDFGNIEILKTDQLKKLTADATKAPILGVSCRFIGYPKVENIDDEIKKNIEDGECYDILIKRFDGSCYEIEAPEVYQKIKEEHL